MRPVIVVYSISMAYVAYLWPSRNTRLLTEFSIVVFILRSFRPFFYLFICVILLLITVEYNYWSIIYRVGYKIKRQIFVRMWWVVVY